jgi:hypothetical protein
LLIFLFFKITVFEKSLISLERKTLAAERKTLAGERKTLAGERKTLAGGLNLPSLKFLYFYYFHFK